MHIRKEMIKAANKFRDRAAFTLAEVLVAIIIMLLVSGILAAGIPAAIRAYDNVVIASNADVLLSTTMSALRNELYTATDIEESSDHKSISYYNEAFSTISKIYVNSTKANNNSDSIMYQRYATEMLADIYGDGIKGMLDTGGTLESSDPKKFMSEAVSDKKYDLYVTYDTVTYDKTNGVVTFHDLQVMRGGKTTKATPAKRNYSIRVIASNDESD